MKDYKCAHCAHCNEIKYDGFFCDKTGYLEHKRIEDDCPDFEADTIEAEHVRLWIPCVERMPETPYEGFGVHFYYSDCVLVAGKDWLGMAYYVVTEGGKSHWEFADARTNQVIDWVEITHWMPLPEPPEVDHGRPD